MTLQFPEKDTVIKIDTEFLFYVREKKKMRLVFFSFEDIFEETNNNKEFNKVGEGQVITKGKKSERIQ